MTGRRSPTSTGAAAVELVVTVPALMVLVLFVVFLGRAGQSTVRVQHAADSAARAASMVRRSAMNEVGSAIALDELGRNGSSCVDATVSVTIDTTDDVATVTVTVGCTVSARGLDLLTSGTRRVSATSTEVIDLYRADES
jgi:Flp pilus assembly protein TadG